MIQRPLGNHDDGFEVALLEKLSSELLYIFRCHGVDCINVTGVHVFPVEVELIQDVSPVAVLLQVFVEALVHVLLHLDEVRFTGTIDCNTFQFLQDDGIQVIFLLGIGIEHDLEHSLSLRITGDSSG